MFDQTFKFFELLNTLPMYLKFWAKGRFTRCLKTKFSCGGFNEILAPISFEDGLKYSLE